MSSPGLGGVFFRARDPAALKAWYAQHFGVPADRLFGPTAVVFEPFSEDTDYFGRREQQFMLNFRVDDLDATLEALRAAGGPVDAETSEHEGLGRFGWAADPEGNRFELWEPAPGL